MSSLSIACHKYTYFSDYHCDVVQLLSRQSKENLIDANKVITLSWSELKDEANIIVSTLKEVGQSLYDSLPTGKSVSPFYPSVSLL